MKRKHFLQRMFSGSLPVLLLAGGLLAACDKEDMTHTEGTPLPEGKYPLVLTASVGEMQTRSAGKDTWADDDPIGVRIGDAGAKVGKYLVSQGGSTQPASDGEALYWQNTAPATITAWHPYEAKNDVDISNQKAGYAGFDYLTAIAENKSYKDKGIELRFKHQMAKVKYTLTHGEGVDEVTLQNAAVAISGYTKATFSEGVLTSSESENGWITPTGDGEALLVPQDMSGKPFFKVSITVDGTSRDFVYTPEDGAANLESGYAYTYTITVKRTGIVVNAMYGEWSDNEENGDAEVATFRVYLPEGHGQILNYGDNVTPKSDYLEVKGNPFTISYTPTDATRTKGFRIAKGKGTVAPRTTTSDGKTYTFTYNLRTDVHLEYSLHAEVGDYYYDDNTWLPYMDGKKTCIGIVFKTGAGPEDAATNYGDKLVEGKIHGYVVALQDAHEAVGIWGIRGNDVGGLTNERNFTDKYNGYTNTQTVRNLSEYGNVDLSRPSSGADQYWAFKAASDYATDAPANSSGWYLPSIGQLQDIYNLPNRAGLLTGAAGTDFKASENDGRYWSSTEYNDIDAWNYRFNGEGWYRYAKGVEHETYCYVRSVLTF